MKQRLILRQTFSSQNRFLAVFTFLTVFSNHCIWSIMMHFPVLSLNSSFTWGAVAVLPIVSSSPVSYLTSFYCYVKFAIICNKPKASTAQMQNCRRDVAYFAPFAVFASFSPPSGTAVQAAAASQNRRRDKVRGIALWQNFGQKAPKIHIFTKYYPL